MKIAMPIHTIIALAIVLTSLAPSRALSVTILFTDETAWSNSLKNVELFKFTNINVATADEVAVAPVGETNLGTTVLTFSAANTGLSRGFTLRAVNSGHTWVFEDRNIAETLSPGDIDPLNLGNDDFEIGSFFGPVLTAFGLDLIGNDLAEGPEFFSVFGPGNILLDSISLPITGPADRQFLGVVSDVAITRIRIDEGGAGNEDIVVANLRFGEASIPEPTTLSLLAFAILSLATSRKQLGRVGANRDAHLFP